MCEKDYIWNPAICSCKSSQYFPSVIDDLVIICDETISETKTIPKNFNEPKVTCSTKNFCMLLFLLTIIELLTGVSIHCYLIKYQAKQKLLLPY